MMTSKPIEILKPRLVAVDSHKLDYIDDLIQNYSNDCESLAYALNTIEADDPASKGVIVAVRSALLAISTHASELSAGIMQDIVSLPEVEAPSMSSNDNKTQLEALSGLPDNALSISQTSQRKIIDMTTDNDKEVVVLSAHDLSDIACDIEGVVTVLNEIGHLLSLVHYVKMQPHIIVTMSRLRNESVNTWMNLLNVRLEKTNQILALTCYGKEVAQ
ncbi:hypothetical protein IPZ60_03500 [Psychrobacter sp. NG25]|uniref:hypothetical protein n=1 Tax=Psychrobacter sp. NG25 TaxID=2782005 RepID=UPI001884810F|nr:hypothetical protein [Psychrobacter sp. NG25]MBF0657800.1 hypothetical protein [Psychrobacter sp. NG25]